MKKFKTFMYKYISGGASVKIGKEKYLSFPKTAIFMTPGVILSGTFNPQVMDMSALYVIGLFLILTGTISFFYPTVNPIKFDELDDKGKLFYGKNYGISHLTPQQRREFLKLKKDN